MMPQKYFYLHLKKAVCIFLSYYIVNTELYSLHEPYFAYIAFLVINKIWAASRQNQHTLRLRPAWIQTSLCIRAVWPGSMLFVYKSKTSSETDSEQHGSWLDCADAQAGLDPCCSQTHSFSDFVFCMEVKMLLWLHFDTFMTNNFTLSASFFRW
jgi:hypothetical protein